MALHQVIADPNELDTITDVIHDCWFDKDDIALHEASSIVEIPFWRERAEESFVESRIGPLKRVRIPTVRYMLRIHHVKSCRITDEARVGRYDFNKLKYDDETRELLVLTGVPIDIAITVTAFKIEVLETDTTDSGRTAMRF